MDTNQCSGLSNHDPGWGIGDGEIPLVAFYSPGLNVILQPVLLDGLDEVALEHRATCVSFINDFVEQIGLPGLVVCSRLQEYLALPEYLRLNGAICLQPPTRSQIENYLCRAGPKLASLHTVLRNDSAFQELA